MGAILITGGAGYIGSHTVHYLLEQGMDPARLVVFDSLIHGHREHLPSPVRLVQGDLRNPEEVEGLFRAHPIDSVIHFAAFLNVGESMLDPGKYFGNNLLGGLNLLQAMHAHGCRRIVFSSTCAIYGMPEQTPIAEEAPQQPINAYGESKLMFERMLRWYEKLHGISHVILRYFNAAGAAYGIGERHHPETHLIPLVMEALLGQRGALQLFGDDYPTPDGSCIRDYIHVVDLAAAHLRALEYLENGGSSIQLNVGTGRGASVREVIRCVEELAGGKVPYTVEARRPGDPAILVADSRKAQAVLGWYPRAGLEEIIQSAWAWHGTVKLARSSACGRLRS